MFSWLQIFKADRHPGPQQTRIQLGAIAISAQTSDCPGFNPVKLPSTWWIWTFWTSHNITPSKLLQFYKFAQVHGSTEALVIVFSTSALDALTDVLLPFQTSSLVKKSPLRCEAWNKKCSAEMCPACQAGASVCETGQSWLKIFVVCCSVYLAAHEVLHNVQHLQPTKSFFQDQITSGSSRTFVGVTEQNRPKAVVVLVLGLVPTTRESKDQMSSWMHDVTSCYLLHSNLRYLPRNPGYCLVQHWICSCYGPIYACIQILSIGRMGWMMQSSGHAWSWHTLRGASATDFAAARLVLPPDNHPADQMANYQNPGSRVNTNIARKCIFISPTYGNDKSWQRSEAFFFFLEENLGFVRTSQIGWLSNLLPAHRDSAEIQSRINIIANCIFYRSQVWEQKNAAQLSAWVSSLSAMDTISTAF